MSRPNELKEFLAELSSGEKNHSEQFEQFLEEINNGEGEKLTLLCRLIPSYRNGKPATLSRLLRWIEKGMKGPDGTRVRLDGLKTPGGWISTPGAITRFFLALTPDYSTDSGNSPTTSQPKNTKQSASNRAAKELAKHGI